MSHNSKLQKVDLIKLNIGDVYWPAKANSKPFKVVEQDPTGYYLACFRGNETEATYIWNGKGMQWFEENWAKSHSEAWQKEADWHRKEADKIESIINKDK